jgi:signal transduction histidine kinase/FixJ family two-component response regulator
MSLAQRIFRIFLYIFFAQLILIGIWAAHELFFSKKSYPEKIVNNLTEIDKSILEGAVLQNEMKAYGARDLLIYRLLETNSLDSVEFVTDTSSKNIIHKFKLEDCNTIQTAILCSRSGGHYLTSLTPLEFDGSITGFLKLEKSLRGYEDTNKKVLFSIGLTALIIFLINLLTIYMVWLRFLRPETLKLLNALSLESKDNSIDTNEFNQIQNLFLSMLSKVKQAEAERSKLESKMEIFSLATQVAHDIRSPLEVLKVLKNDLELLPLKTRRLAWTSIHRIEEIAFNLLKTHRDNLKTEEYNIEEFNLLKMLISLVAEKSIEYRHLNGIELLSLLNENSYPLYTKFNRNVLQRTLSNIINNAIESLPPTGGLVTIGLTTLNGQNLIKISDTGPGIPPEIQGRLFQKGFTTKTEGNGIGLHHAKIELERLGGSISFTSEIGQGTTFLISLPTSSAPPVFPHSIDLSNYNKVIVLDDDPSLHEAWGKRFEGLEIPVEYFSSSKELLKTYQNLSSDILLLCDYQLRQDELDGISCITTLLHQPGSILVTARDEERDIFSRCLEQGIKLLAKELISFIPITNLKPAKLNTLQIVLIDDDRFIHIGWKDFFSNYNFHIDTFTSMEAFYREINHYRKDAIICIDSNLGNGVRGELESKNVFELGFENIFMVTGYDRDHFSGYPWIKDVISKGPQGILKHINA